MNPTRNPGPLVPVRVAADLTAIEPAELNSLVRSGAVRSQRIKGVVYVDLDDAERAVRDRRQGGGK